MVIVKAVLGGDHFQVQFYLTSLPASVQFVDLDNRNKADPTFPAPVNPRDTRIYPGMQHAKQSILKKPNHKHELAENQRIRLRSYAFSN